VRHRRRAWALAVLVTAFLTVGVPRWLAGDGQSAVPSGTETFTKLCRGRGGTLQPASVASPQPHCVVRYGGTEYVMDAVTPHGWDQDAAALQQDGCAEAERLQASTTSGELRMTFIFHPATGVCERTR
jgi:hypothetical protein